MANSKKTRRMPLFKRILYLLVVLSGGSGGWLVKDHPTVQAALSLLTGKPGPGAAEAGDDAEKALATRVAELFHSHGQYDQPGTYQVTIPEVRLDPHLFKMGHTVDIQARVLKVGPHGRPTTLWETKPFGERLAVAGKDDLVAGWPQRPFQVEWNPGDRLTIEVYDRRTGLFLDPKKFVLAPTESEPREFPLKPGTFPLEAAQKPDVPVDPRNTSIVLQSLRVGDLQGERPAIATGRREAGAIGPRDPAPRGDDGTIVIK